MDKELVARLLAAAEVLLIENLSYDCSPGIRLIAGRCARMSAFCFLNRALSLTFGKNFKQYAPTLSNPLLPKR